MSFGGNTSNLPLPEPKLGGLDNKRLSTNEQARPLPIVYGTQRVGVTFVSTAFNQRSEAVEQEMGKKKGVTGYNYFASFAALVCHGPVDAIQAIYFDDELVWPAAGGAGISRSAEDSVQITIPSPVGTWTWYWGTESGEIDAELLKLSEDVDANPAGVAEGNVGEEHPAYRGQCYFVAHDQFLGYNRTAVPNIEVVVKRIPSIDWLDGGDVDGDCRIEHVAVDLAINHRYGLGLRDVDEETSRLDRAGIAEFSASQVHPDLISRSLVGVSPLINRAQPWRQVLVQLLEYVDGYFAATAAGKFTLGVVRSIDCDDESILDFDENHLTEALRLKAGGWNQGYNQVSVGFTNRDAEYKSDATPGVAAGHLQATGEPAVQVLQRPWITKIWNAKRVARATAYRSAMPSIEGTMTVLEKDLRGLTPGQLFRLSYSHYGLCGLPCRVAAIAQEDPYTPEVQVEWRADYSWLNDDTTPSADYAGDQYTPPRRNRASVNAIARQQPVELPYSKEAGENPFIAMLVERPSKLAAGYVVYQEVTTNSYSRVDDAEYFALSAELGISYGASDSGVVQIQLRNTHEPMPDDISAAEAAADTWLMFINDEIFSIHTPLPVEGEDDTFTVSVLRERLDSKKLAHAAGDQVWIMNSSRLKQIAFLLNRPLSQGQVLKLKTVPRVIHSEGALADATEVTLTYSQRSKRPWKPKLLTAPSTYNGGSSVAVSWTAVNKEGGSVFAPAWDGPTWKLEVRLAGDSAEYPATTPRLKKDLRPELTSTFLEMPELQAALGGSLQTFIVRTYVMQRGLPSRHYEEATVTKV